jgi:hypothetical protein
MLPPSFFDAIDNAIDRQFALGLLLGDALKEGRIREVVFNDNYGEAHPILPQRQAPTPAPTLAYATKTAVEREAERQVETRGVTDPQATPQPANAKPADLGARERTTAYKLILGLAARGYKYRPTKTGERTTVIPEIVGDLERLGLGLSDETVRKWLAEAYEALGRPDLD